MNARRWKRYPHYRDSGVEWLGEVPAHWQSKRLRFAVDFNPSRSRASHLSGSAKVSFVAMEAVGEWGGLDLSTSKSVDDIGTGYTWFQDGDVVVAKITPCFENGKAAFAHGLTNGAAFGTTELHVLRPHPEIEGWFLFYLTLSHPFREVGASTMYGAGGQKRVPETFIRDYRPGIPPLVEQRAIAAFLDRETARIDALIAKKEELIRLMEEKQTALISQLVTKGLDPSVPMKDPGLPWVDEIPQHWLVLRLKRLAERITSGPRGWSEYLTDERDAPMFIQSGNIGRRMDLDLDGVERVTSPDGAESQRTILRHDDVVVCITGARTGSVAHVRAPLGAAFINQHIALVRLRTGTLRSRLIAYQLFSAAGQSQLDFIQYGMKGGLALEDIRETLVLVPPAPEQDNIVKFLDASSSDAEIFAVRKAQGLLREQRQALITAAVTGQIDVRDEAAA